MKLHDLHPAPGSRRKRTRVGRGIAAGQGKTAGRGTKGQKARAGASIPAWFEGGQTPIHIRVPKLRGFKNRFKIQYSVVNVGAISEYAAAGRFGVELDPAAKRPRGKSAEKGTGSGPVTVNAEVLASAGLIGSTERPLKVLGQGDVTEKLFVAADAFSASARRKIEDAGGFVQLLAPEKVAPEKEPSEAEAEAATEPTESAPTTEASAEPSGESADEVGEAPALTEEPAAGAKPARKRAAAKQQDASDS